MPAHATAKSVMASAKRLIEVRHCWRSKSRIAEISVPAWPMPIHHTKLMMSKPQATGTLMPQMPMPCTTRLVSATSRSIRSENEIVNPRSQPRGVLRSRTIAPILSVTDSKV